MQGVVPRTGAGDEEAGAPSVPRRREPQVGTPQIGSTTGRPRRGSYRLKIRGDPQLSGPGRLAGIVAAGLLVGACSSGDPQGPIQNCSVAAATPVNLTVGQYVSLDPTASSGGCFGFPANASSVDSAEYLVIAQSAASIPTDSSPFVLTGISATGGPAPAVASRRYLVPRARSNAAAFDAFLHDPARPWNAPPGVRVSVSPTQGAIPASPAGSTPVVGDVRSFVICAVFDCSKTSTVSARAAAVGLHVAIYFDTLSPLPGYTAGLAQADVDSLLQVLDGRVYASDTQAFGSPSDIDANNVVIALLSPVVNALVTRTDCEANGFIAGFFFAGDLYPGLSQIYNNGEVYYSVVPDPDSVVSCAHTVASVKRLAPPTFAHELEHMINFGQHVLIRRQSAEQGWLDEGLARYGEELAARTFLPGDSASFHSYLVYGDLYNAGQYLLNPGASYLLLVQDDGTLAEAGDSWLFVRYVVDQFGPSVAGQLVQSPYFGASNLGSRTGTNFQTLVTNWALALWVSDLPGFAAPARLKYTSWSLRAIYDTLYQFNPGRFPRPFPLAPAVTAANLVNLSGELRSGTGYYARALQGPSAPAFALNFTLDGSHALPGVIVPRLSVIRTR